MSTFKISLILIILTLLASCSGEPEKFDSVFAVVPSKPQPGKELKVKYLPEGTPLEKAEKIDMLAYQFIDKDPVVVKVEMEKNGKGWVAEWTPEENAKVAIIQFESGEEKDNNQDKGYVVLMYGTDGKEVKGAHSQLAQVRLYGGHIMRLERYPDLALKEINREFGLYPGSKKELRPLWFAILWRNDRNRAGITILKTLDSLSALKNLTLDDKKLLATWYRQIGDAEAGKKYEEEVLKEDPLGDLSQDKRLKELYYEADMAKKEALYSAIKRDFAGKSFVNTAASIMLNAYAKNNRLPDAVKFVEENSGILDANGFNSIAWTLVEKNSMLEKAVELAEKAVELAEKDYNKPYSEKPVYYTQEQWRKSQRRLLGGILDTYGYALYLTGKVEEAVSAYKEAVNYLDYADQEINTRYAVALIDAEKYDDGLKFLDKIMGMGQNSELLAKMFRRCFMEINGTDEGVDEKLSAYRNESLSGMREELQKKMMNKPAPDFVLEDLEGKKVSLKDYRGKVVVVDFWATWCNPCLQSFPGMKMALTNYKPDPEVAFLFINTWEKGDDIKKNTIRFILENQYPFRVLLDLKNEVVSAFKVQGIPTKFVIDKKGNIRFTSVGFGGNVEELVNELSMMIEMAKNE
jgi:peroxiredoxin